MPKCYIVKQRTTHSHPKGNSTSRTKHAVAAVAAVEVVVPTILLLLLHLLDAQFSYLVCSH